MIDLAQRYKGIVMYNPAEYRCIMDNRTVELIIKDLELLEKYKRVMCEPILDILKNIIVVVPNTKYTSGPKYYIMLRQDVSLNDETKEMIKEWLENGKNNL